VERGFLAIWHLPAQPPQCRSHAIWSGRAPSAMALPSRLIEAQCILRATRSRLDATIGEPVQCGLRYCGALAFDGRVWPQQRREFWRVPEGIERDDLILRDAKLAKGVRVDHGAHIVF